MSNIPAARKLIASVLAGEDDISSKSRASLRLALRLMVRTPHIRRAATKRGEYPITEKQRREVKRLSRNASLTEHEIAVMTGLRNAGRVSDVLHGRR